MVKTTIDIPDDKWKKFSIKVIEEYGGRKKNDVIEELNRQISKGKESSKEVGLFNGFRKVLSQNEYD